MLKSFHRSRLVILIVVLLVGFWSVVAVRATSDWQTLAPGMDLKYVIAVKPSFAGDSKIVILRMEPSLWQLEALGISQSGESGGHTARAWSERSKFTAAINAGMFATDQKTHLGYMRSGKYVNNSRPNAYQSVAAFDPRASAALPRS